MHRSDTVAHWCREEDPGPRRRIAPLSKRYVRDEFCNRPTALQGGDDRHRHPAARFLTGERPATPRSGCRHQRPSHHQMRVRRLRRRGIPKHLSYRYRHPPTTRSYRSPPIPIHPAPIRHRGEKPLCLRTRQCSTCPTPRCRLTRLRPQHPFRCRCRCRAGRSHSQMCRADRPIRCHARQPTIPCHCSYQHLPTGSRSRCSPRIQPIRSIRNGHSCPCCPGMACRTSGQIHS